MLPNPAKPLELYEDELAGASAEWEVQTGGVKQNPGLGVER